VRPIQPAHSGHLTLEGFGIYYEVFGDDSAPALLLLPTWQIVHSRHWKMQVPYLSHYFRVITYDSPGNGGGERTEDPAAFEYDRITDQGVGLLEHLGVKQASVLAFSRGCYYALWMAARYPEQVTRLVLIGNGVSPDFSPASDPAFWQEHDTYEGWDKWNAHYWLEHYPGWLDFFFGEFFTEPHSTKGFEDCVGWGTETTPQILTRTTANADLYPRMPVREVLERLRCPVLLLHGEDDRIAEIELTRQLADARPDFELVTLEGSGHGLHVRDAVKANLEIVNFLNVEKPKRRTWHHALTRRPRRALYISSPIGLGHVQRDMAIARELRALVPGLEIDWWAQHPVTRVLEEAGERIHPMSRLLASESAHWEEESSGHELHAFYAFRRMDEIFLYNFMLLHDLVSHEQYDIWIGDESWEVDYYLHENPELKTAPYVFLTDVIGFLPVDPEGDPHEAYVCADYNAEMIEQRARYRRLRDLSLYVGEYDDLPPDRFGPGLPRIRDWTQEWFEQVGYVLPFNPADYRDPVALRAKLGYEEGGPLLFAAVGGTSVGRNLLRKVAEAFPLLREEVPDARMVMVTGPRIDPGDLPDAEGMEKRPYVHNLFEHLACADAAVVQGGLTTTMELVAARRPFIYFPLRRHWEQLHHVAYRLDHYRAGTRLDYESTSRADLAQALKQALRTPVDYREIAPGGARRAAERIATLL
jgi:pimeloyl-ACP methyl ester carboxylesterase/UDP:flavonoid glycosyltransferase YjiC (YdhE family)